MVFGDIHFQSPNAIPPRRSSTGLGTGYVNPTQPVLKPVPESSWIAQEAPKHTKQPSLTTAPSKSSSEANTPDSADSVAKHVQGTAWSAEKERIVLGPFDYMFDHPGKDIRKDLIAAFNAWLKVPEESLAIITRVVGMLHTASLLYAAPPTLPYQPTTNPLAQRRRRRRLLPPAARHPRRPQHLWHRANYKLSQLHLLPRAARAHETPQFKSHRDLHRRALQPASWARHGSLLA